MKNTIEQLEYLDKTILPLFGIKGLVDYTTVITLRCVKQIPNLIQDLNNQITNIKMYFGLRKFNLYKTENRFKTFEQAFACLKTCMTIANVPFSYNNGQVRQIPKNNLLEEYIKSMAARADINKNADINVSRFDKVPTNDKVEDLNNGIQKMTNVIKSSESMSYTLKNIEGKWDKETLLYEYKMNMHHYPFLRYNTKNLRLVLPSDCNLELTLKLKIGGQDLLTTRKVGEIFEDVLPIEYLYYHDFVVVIFSKQPFYIQDCLFCMDRVILDESFNYLKLKQHASPLLEQVFDNFVFSFDKKMYGVFSGMLQIVEQLNDTYFENRIETTPSPDNFMNFAKGQNNMLVEKQKKITLPVYYVTQDGFIEYTIDNIVWGESFQNLTINEDVEEFILNKESISPCDIYKKVWGSILKIKLKNTNVNQLTFVYDEISYSGVFVRKRLAMNTSGYPFFTEQIIKPINTFPTTDDMSPKIQQNL